VYWVRLIQDKVNCGDFVNMVMNFRVTLSMDNFFTSLASVSVSRRAQHVEDICMFYKNFVLLAVEKSLVMCVIVTASSRASCCVGGPDPDNRNNEISA
jgi:hypothetical protein